MFCNGPKTDEGNITRLGPTTIIGMTIPRCYSSLVMTLDDTGGLAGPISRYYPFDAHFHINRMYYHPSSIAPLYCARSI